ncbi:MAG: amidase [Acidimicrobiaceae bacterium]|jgi:amidase
MTDDIGWLDATAQAELVRTGQVSPAELVEGAITRTEKLNPEINAMIHPRFDKARVEAAAALPDGPFRGVPIMIKDLSAPSEGDPQHNGMRVLRDMGYIAPADNHLVARYRKAGFVMIGRTNTPELGLVPTTEPESHGATRNPWDTGHTPGGSSGGSAAAVAAGMVSIAHASDGGGSIRIPASMCGLVGLKVSRGRITMGPDRDESQLGVAHVVARSVRDVAGALDVTQGPAPGDMVVAPPPNRPYVEEVGADPGRLRIGVLAHNPNGALHADCETAVRTTAALLESLGHHVEESHPPPLDRAQENGRAFISRWSTGAKLNLIVTGRLVGRDLTADDVEPYTWAMAEMANGVTGVDLAMALAACAAFTREMAGWWAGGFDLLLSPTLGGPPPRLGELMGTPDNPFAGGAKISALVPYTTHFNVTGQPAISVPMHWNDAGLPIGIQLAAAYGREDLLFQVAAQLEQAQPWSHRRPPVSA